MKFSAQRSRPVALALCLLVLAGCSTFNRDWNRAARQPVPRDSLLGRWEGSWLSDANQHTGELRCLVTRVDDTKVNARFRATYGRIFRFSYAVLLAVQPHYDGWEFSGEENLGRLAGGVYYYEGRATATNFFSIYRSKYDRGTFLMHRPK